MEYSLPNCFETLYGIVLCITDCYFLPYQKSEL